MSYHHVQGLKQTQMFRRRLLLAAPFLILNSRLAEAEGSAVAATASALLTVNGDILRPTHGNEAVFDLAGLDHLPQAEFTTSTIWSEGARRFSGPTLQGLLDHVGAGPGDIMATAVNNYVVNISQSLVTQTAPIIASRIDGALFPLRRKGPLWIIFPFDSDSSYRTELFYASSVWQLHKLTILQS